MTLVKFKRFVRAFRNDVTGVFFVCRRLWFRIDELKRFGDTVNIGDKKTFLERAEESDFQFVRSSAAKVQGLCARF